LSDGACFPFFFADLCGLAPLREIQTAHCHVATALKNDVTRYPRQSALSVFIRGEATKHAEDRLTSGMFHFRFPLMAPQMNADWADERG
jgi:hypothetical protein